jgi:hypothetical protein
VDQRSAQANKQSTRDRLKDASDRTACSILGMQRPTPCAGLEKECDDSYHSEQQQFKRGGVLLHSTVAHEVRVSDVSASSGAV